jgi:hypothetical protein
MLKRARNSQRHAPITGTRYLALTLTLLIVWLVWIAYQGYEDGFRIPLSSLTLCLTLFWAWVGVSSLWSVVPAVSRYTFWRMGGLPLAFWAYVLAPDRWQIWRLVASGVLAVDWRTVAGVLAYLSDSYTFKWQSSLLT